MFHRPSKICVFFSDIIRVFLLLICNFFFFFPSKNFEHWFTRKEKCRRSPKKKSLARSQNRRVAPPPTLPLLLLQEQEEDNWDVGTAVRLGGAVLVGPAETIERKACTLLSSVLPLADRSGTPFLRLVLRLQQPSSEDRKNNNKLQDLAERFERKFGGGGLRVVVVTTKNSELPGGWKVVRSVYQPEKKNPNGTELLTKLRLGSSQLEQT